jgi:hypothetical protein
MQREPEGFENEPSTRSRRELVSADAADSPDGDTWQLLGELRRHGVAFVLFGSGGARAHGAMLPVGDIDICPDPDPRNLERLAVSLDALDARPRVIDGFTTADEAAIWRSRPATLENLDHLFDTTLGPLDVVPRPFGPHGRADRFTFADLDAGAQPLVLAGHPVRVADVRDLMASKLSADRPKDRAALAELQRLVAAHDPSHKAPDHDL